MKQTISLPDIKSKSTSSSRSRSLGRFVSIGVFARKLHYVEYQQDKRRNRYSHGAGNVPGLNAAIRGVTIGALREGYHVNGIRRGRAGLIDIVREKDHDDSANFQMLSEELVNRAGCASRCGDRLNKR